MGSMKLSELCGEIKLFKFDSWSPGAALFSIETFN